MDRLRTPFLIAALVLIALVVLGELGHTVLVEIDLSGSKSKPQITAQHLQLLGEIVPGAEGNLDLELPAVEDEPPGKAIGQMALVDGTLLFTVGLMALGLLIKERLQGRVQGVITLIFSILILIAAITAIILTLVELLIMVGLLLAVPFGTIAYMVMYGFFNRGGARAVLSVLTGLRVPFAVCMVLAHQRFLQNKGLVLLTLTAFVTSFIVGLLHGIVPLFLVSITDAVAAIVVDVIAAIWAIVLLIGSLISIVKAVQR